MPPCINTGWYWDKLRDGYLTPDPLPPQDPQYDLPENQLDALNGANAPSSINPFATIADIHEIRTGSVVLPPGVHTVTYSSTIGTLNYTLQVTVIQNDGASDVQLQSGFIVPTSQTGFDATIPAGNNATVTYTAIKI
jgi:hypothetical protein